MEEKQITFTIFTPCYNSARFIHRVFESLTHQTYRNFEWIVVNDASTDNTGDLIRDFIKTAGFEIQFFDLAENQMITKSYNLAIRHARGQYFLPAGHDDEFVPETLATLLRYWEQYGSDRFSGISCLCRDQNGQIVGDPFPQSPYYSDYFDVVFNKRINGEKWGFTRTDLMKKFTLPEDVDVYIPEGVIWRRIGAEYKTIYINETLRIYYVNQSGHESLSTEKKFRSVRGIRYSNQEMINNHLHLIRGNVKIKVVHFINYIRMSLHSQTSLKQMVGDIKSIQHKIITLCLLPAGYLVAAKDRRQGRV